MAKNGLKLMDSDMHIIEPPDLWERYIDPAFKDRAPRGWPGHENPSVLEVAGRVYPKSASKPSANYQTMYDKLHGRYEHAIKRGYDAESQLQGMDTEGIDVAVLFPTRGLYALASDALDPDLAAAIARAYNDWLADFCSTDPQRLLGSAMVAPHNIDAAVLETRRMVEEHGFKSIFMRPNIVGGRNWSDPAYDPLWAEAERHGIAVGFHEGGEVDLPQTGTNFPTTMMRHTCTHPMSMMLAVVDIIGGGVLERFPTLRVAFLEGNCSWAPFLLWRLDEHYEWRGEYDGQHLSMKPSDYFKRQCYLSIECDEEPARYAIEALGEKNFVFSTDYPHADSKYPESADRFLDLPLSESAQRHIMWDNCARLYGLE
jgi:predicted TIM-barrel fold metal-dependent hydrolase